MRVQINETLAIETSKIVRLRQMQVGDGAEPCVGIVSDGGDHIFWDGDLSDLLEILNEGEVLAVLWQQQVAEQQKEQILEESGMDWMGRKVEDVELPDLTPVPGEEYLAPERQEGETDLDYLNRVTKEQQ